MTREEAASATIFYSAPLLQQPADSCYANLVVHLQPSFDLDWFCLGRSSVQSYGLWLVVVG